MNNLHRELIWQVDIDFILQKFKEERHCLGSGYIHRSCEGRWIRYPRLFRGTDHVVKDMITSKMGTL